MNFNAIGDMAQLMTRHRHSADLQQRLAELTAELSTGEAADASKHLNGSFGQLADIEHRMAVNRVQKAAGAEAAIQASAMQTALELVQDQLADVSDAVMSTMNGVESASLDATATIARGALDAIVSALNTSVAGRSVFAGTARDQVPLIGSEALMDAARNAVSGAGDSASVTAALDTFFAPGGGFETIVYKGGVNDLAPVSLGAGESVQLSIRADDPVLRSALKDTVMAALAGDDALVLAPEERVALLHRAGDSMLSDLGAVTGMRSDLGFAEARIERSLARVSAEQAGLSMTRNEMMSVDKFETASALEQVRIQLETIYTVTARTSRLNLVNFL